MKRFLSALCFWVLGTCFVYAQSGEITGTVTDENGEGVPFANVAAKQGGSIIAGTTTDFDGNYTIKPLDPGKYDIHVTFIGYAEQVTQGVQVNSDKITSLDASLKPEETVLGVVDIVEYKVPLIDKENNSTKNTISKEDIAVMATRNVESIASTSAGVYQEDEGSALSIKGARADGTEYYIDGIRVRGSTNLPANAIEQLTVITGGVPAKYGDATGGIINVTTRGPSRQFGGGLEILTSQFLDDFGYNLGNFNLTGPIVKKYKGTDSAKTIVGFFLAGEYLYRKDGDPSAVGVYKAKDDVLNQLEQAPLVLSESSDAFIVAAETVTADDLEKQEFKPNVASHRASGTAKIDVKASDNINLSFGGTVNYFQGHDWVARYGLFNYDNHPLSKDLTWRVFGRFTQKFGKSGGYGQDEARSAFQNAYYTVQFDYTKVTSREEDDTHGFNAFDYGYVGGFETSRAPIYQFGDDDVSGKTGWQLVGFQDTLVTFTPGDANPVATNYTQTYYDLAGDDPEGFYETIDQIVANNGLRNGDLPRIPHGIWVNAGRQWNRMFKVDNDQFRISVNGSVDILPPGAAVRNKHAIEFGFEFEQRIDRQWVLSPIGLWTQMRLLTNRHIDQLDTENPILLIDGEQYAYNDPNAPAFGFNDTILYNRLYDASLQATFDSRLRATIGAGQTELINIDGLSPDVFDLGMFSPDELLNNGNGFVSYSGFDYTGKKLSSQPSFDDFFQATDENGNFTRPIGAFRPIYTAAYIQDKFNFKDLLFNVGVRIDRFDANQKVLKDQYSLYETLSVEEALSSNRVTATEGDIPNSIGNDYVVYVDEATESPANILGFRSGDTWYNANGEELQTASLIAQSSATGQITPLLARPGDDIKSSGFQPSTSFEDYSPQITVMPRIAFSFNITDEASFFAHYDVLAQRPGTGLFASPTQWLFFEDNIGGVLQNPNLKPEKTIDYQLGFRQLVSRNSAITISAFYREMRDMIQVVNVAFAYPRDYLTFGNVDFGTVKGLSIAYDLRKTRTSNFSMKLNYTIQFAEGTGSNSTSQLNLVGSGQPNLRTIVPLDFDSRHNIAVTLDYSFSGGKDYNGPKWGGKDWFANSGVNLIARARSGEPYTKQTNATPTALFTQPQRPILEGSINGARLPWNFKLDFRVFKDFKLSGKVKEGEAPKRPLYLNVYLQIQNLLDTRNIIAVYPYTGNPDDDGYLSSPEGLQDVESRPNAESFVDLYNAWINNPNNYSRPRTIRLGAIFSF